MWLRRLLLAKAVLSLLTSKPQCQQLIWHCVVCLQGLADEHSFWAHVAALYAAAYMMPHAPRCSSSYHSRGSRSSTTAFTVMSLTSVSLLQPPLAGGQAWDSMLRHVPEHLWRPTREVVGPLIPLCLFRVGPVVGLAV